MRLLQFAVNCSRINRARGNVTQLRQAGRVSAWSVFVAIATLFVVVGSVGNAAAQSTDGRPYPNYNWNSYYGPLYYNPGYAQYGLPGVGVSPWNPIVQAQLDLGLRTARYNLYSAWADEANAAANLRHQQAVGHSIQNRKQARRAQAPISAAEFQSVFPPLLKHPGCYHPTTCSRMTGRWPGRRRRLPVDRLIGPGVPPRRPFKSL